MGGGTKTKGDRKIMGIIFPMVLSHSDEIIGSSIKKQRSITCR